MGLKTLPANVKAAFGAASPPIMLTATEEHMAASLTSIDWSALLKEAGTLAYDIVMAVLAAYGVANPPAQQRMAKCHTGGCDHHACCCKAFKLSLATTKEIAKHLCDCCDSCQAYA